MTDIKKYMIMIFILFFTLSLPLQSEEMKKIAQTGMKWLSIPIGPRASAMGGAFTAVANDAGSIFWNPAGLAYTSGTNVFLSQTQWIADINVNAGAASYDASGWGIFSLSFATVDYGTFNGTRRDPGVSAGYVETGTFSPTDWQGGLGYARRISDRFAIGGHLKYLYENLGSTLIGKMGAGEKYTAEMSMLAFDIGTIYYTGFKDLKIAMVLQNFSEEKKYVAEKFPLPLTFKFGVAMDLTKIWMEESEHQITLAIDAIHPRDFSERLLLGLEYGFRDLVFLRGGYKIGYDEEDLTLGAGVQYTTGGIGLGIDYSYVQFKHFDAVQMFGFMIKF
jgi:hypothetical protein